MRNTLDSVQKPEIIAPIDTQEVLEILKAQLEILKLLSSPVVFIPADSGIDTE